MLAVGRLLRLSPAPAYRFVHTRRLVCIVGLGRRDTAEFACLRLLRVSQADTFVVVGVGVLGPGAGFVFIVLLMWPRCPGLCTHTSHTFIELADALGCWLLLGPTARVEAARAWLSLPCYVGSLSAAVQTPGLLSFLVPLPAAGGGRLIASTKQQRPLLQAGAWTHLLRPTAVSSRRGDAAGMQGASRQRLGLAACGRLGRHVLVCRRSCAVLSCVPPSTHTAYCVLWVHSIRVPCWSVVTAFSAVLLRSVSVLLACCESLQRASHGCAL